MTMRVGSTEFAQIVRRFGDPDSPALAGRFARRVAALIVDGPLNAERVNGRWYVDPAMAPKAAQLMGLVPAEEDKALYHPATKNPPAACNG